MIGTRFRWLGTVLLAGSLSLTACGSRSTAPEHSTPAASVSPGSLQVFAAASLRGAFAQMGKLFETNHPGTKVELTLEGSADLVSQITQGADADVLATADTANMQKAWKAGAVINPLNFAANSLTIVVAHGNPKGVKTFADLARPGLDVVVCASQVPCGAAAAKVAKSAGVHLNPVSEESSVTDVLNKVTSGQADAGLVYFTDAKLAGDKVTAVSFPQSADPDAVNTYPIAVTTGGRNPERANQFVELVTSEAGHKILADAGFSAP